MAAKTSARSSKSKAKTPAAREAVPAEPARAVAGRLQSFLFRPKVLILMAAAVSATVLLPVLMPKLSKHVPDLRTRPEYRLKLSAIHTNKAPSFVPPNLVAQVLDRARWAEDLPWLEGEADELDVLHDELLPQMANAFAAHPWVKAVVRVRRSIPARLDVELVYRQPVAMVQLQEWLYPVDRDGVTLPAEDFSAAQARGYPLITNVVSTPQGASGLPWGDEVVEHAAQLAAILVRRPEGDDAVTYWSQFGLAEIRVPRRDRADVSADELNFQLITQGGSRVIWGRPPATDHPGELEVDQKIGRLEYLMRLGGLDLPHGPYEYDIRHWQDITRHPISSAESPPRR